MNIQPDDPNSKPIKVTDDGTQISITDPNHGNVALSVRDSTTVGDICEFISSRLKLPLEAEEYTNPPAKLKGATTSGSFEDLITKEGNRLKGLGIMELGRYPVASVMIKGSKFPMQIPSKPDFEGVCMGGQQFIFEAKVSSQGSFRISKVFVKHKQISHMIERSKFGVPCWILIHFNERKGATFYDPAFTVAIPIHHKDGWDVWRKFAECKDKKKEFDSLTRDLARELGKVIRWHVPPRCKGPRPVLQDLLD